MLSHRPVVTVLLAFALSLAAFGQLAQTDHELPPEYVSDHCSMFPDGDWGDCCVEHDKAYFFGGTKQERSAADKKLYKCVKGKGHRFIARIMWLGVRIGGVGFLPTPFRWGFGEDWKKPTDR